MVGEYAYETNPNKVCADKCKIHMQTVLGRINGWLQMNECMDLDEPQGFVKTNLDRNCLQPKNLYILSNDYNMTTAPTP